MLAVFFIHVLDKNGSTEYKWFDWIQMVPLDTIGSKFSSWGENQEVKLKISLADPLYNLSFLLYQKNLSEK